MGLFYQNVPAVRFRRAAQRKYGAAASDRAPSRRRNARQFGAAQTAYPKIRIANGLRRFCRNNPGMPAAAFPAPAMRMLNRGGPNCEQIVGTHRIRPAT